MAALLLLVVGVFLGALGVIAFVKPKYVFLLLLVSRPILDHFNVLKTVSLPIFGVNGLQVIGAILPLLLIATCLLKKMDVAHRDVFFFRDRLSNYYMLFVLACLPALLTSSQPVLHFGDWLKFLTFWSICIFAQNFLETREDCRQALQWVIIASLYPMAMFMKDFITGNTVYLGGLTRILGGYYQDRNIFAADLMICFVPAYLYFLVRAERSFFKGGCRLGFAFLIVCIAATNFRTSIAAALLMCLIFLFFRRRYTAVLVMLGAMILALLLVPPLRAKFAPAWIALMNIGDILSPRPTINDPLISTRFGIYRTLLTTVINRFTPGNLIAGYGYALPLKAFWVDSAHMEFLQVFFRYGLLPALLFYWFLFTTIRQGLGYRFFVHSQAITSFIAGVAVISLMGNPFSNVRVLWYLGVYVALLSHRSLAKGAETTQPVYCGGIDGAS